MNESPGSGRLGRVSWALYDWANNGFSTVILTFVFAPYFTEKVAANAVLGSNLWGNMLSLCNVLVALAGPVLGALADRSGRRKPWVAVFTWICVGSTAALWFVRPDQDWTWYALIFTGIGVTGSLFAMIFYNSMLPFLVHREYTGRWSGWAWGLGYLGGLACLGLGLVLFLVREPLVSLEETNGLDIRAVFLLSAAWYFFFSLPLLLFTPDAPGRGIKKTEAVREGLRQLKDSLSHVKKYKNILWFLIARMLYNDGMATLFAFGGIYAAGTFGLDKTQVMIFGFLISASAGIGALIFGWVDDRIGPKHTILICIGALITLGSILVLITSEWYFWIFGTLLGFFIGPVQAASRSYLSRTAPEELRSQFFGLYALSGKLTAFVGPLIVGWLTWISQSQRIGLSSLLLFFVAGGAVLLKVDKAG